MQTENLIVKDEGTVTRITLNRPEKRNALSHDLMSELIAALRGVDQPGGRASRAPAPASRPGTTCRR